MPATRPGVHERVYSALLHSYPADFRDEYGSEMRLAFRDRLNEHRDRGQSFGTVRLWLQVLTDAAFRAPAEHVDILAQDLRYALRALRRAKTFALMAILTLALGIGANTAIFSVVYAVILRPLPLPEPDRLVRIWEKNDSLNIPRFAASIPNFASWYEQAQSFEALGAYRQGSVTLTSDAEPVRASSAGVTASFFPVLGLSPTAGRFFEPKEDVPGGPRVAVLLEAFWRRQFGADPAIVGKTVTMNGEAVTIVGILPLTGLPTPAEVFLPMRADVANELRGNHMLTVVGRLRPGATRGQAQAELESIAGRLSQQYPDSNRGWSVASASFMDWIVPEELRRGLYLILGAVCCVLLIACSNVANLMLARATGRRREMALRLAIGAARRRLVRQVFTESVLLSLIGGACGVLVAFWGVPLLQRWLPSTLPRAGTIAVNGEVLAFSMGVSLLTGLVFGAFPALAASRRDVIDALRDGVRSTAGGTQVPRHALVVAEIALATVLLVAAGLLAQSLQRLQRVTLGFNPERTITAMISLPPARYGEHAQGWSFYSSVLSRLEDTPGVRSAAFSSGAPFSGGNTGMPITAEGASQLGSSSLQTDWRMVSPGYFRAMDIPLLRGRLFDATDRKGNDAVILVSADMARRIWGTDDPIGRRVKAGGPVNLFRVVGVVGDVRNLDLSLEPNPTMYASTTQSLWPTMTVLVRVEGNPGAAVPAIRQAVRELDPQLAIYNVREMEAMVEQNAGEPRLIAWLVGLFAVMALVLSMVGIYGVLSYLVTQRTQEIGVRMALGASAADVLRLVLSRGVALAAAGLAAGGLGTVLLARSISSLLFGITSLDPPTFLASAGLLGIVALLASLIPALRASRVDPLIALRSS